MMRYDGWYANRPRGARQKEAPATAADAATLIEAAEREVLPLGEARRRWAELLRRICEVDPLACPACGSAMRILALMTEGAVIDRILAHLLRARGAARSPPRPPGRAHPSGHTGIEIPIPQDFGELRQHEHALGALTPCPRLPAPCCACHA